MFLQSLANPTKWNDFHDPTSAPLQRLAIDPTGHGSHDVMVQAQAVAAFVPHRILDQRQAQPVGRRRIPPLAPSEDLGGGRDSDLVPGPRRFEIDRGLLLVPEELVYDMAVLVELPPSVVRRASAPASASPLKKVEGARTP
ncbi:MAG: hypothetical protein WKF75_13980 [Singulisphaera sp.]